MSDIYLSVIMACSSGSHRGRWIDNGAAGPRDRACWFRSPAKDSLVQLAAAMAHQSPTGSSTLRRGPQLVNLPADILRTILDLLDVDVYWGPDRRTLRALSLTSKALTAHAQRLLFRSPFFTLDLYRHITRIIVDENNRVVGLEGSLGPTEEEPLTKFTRALKRNPALGLYVRSFKLSIRPPRTHDYDQVDPGRKHRRPDSPDSEDSDDSDDLPVKNDDDHHHRVRRPWHQKLVEKEFYSFLPLFTRLQHLHIVVQRHHLDNLDPPPYSVARVLELLSSSDRLESLHLESTRLDLPFSPTASLPPNTIPALSRLKRLVLDNCEWDSPRSPSPSSERSSPPAPTGTDMSTASGGSCQPEHPPLHLEHLTIYGPRTSSLQPIAALQAPNTLREFHLCTNRNMSMDYKSLYRFDRTGSSTTESTSPSSSSEVVPLRVLLKKSSKSLEKFMFSYPPGVGLWIPNTPNLPLRLNLHLPLHLPHNTHNIHIPHQLIRLVRLETVPISNICKF
ncbi:hypothetical protein CC2G_006375 [Coprinopsis cinerea AmutBmut pab1-1]|nr:hypothetical protein CC2G_006375 [Coprinopsis cinerea AmutBmut pab1-1]